MERRFMTLIALIVMLCAVTPVLAAGQLVTEASGAESEWVYQGPDRKLEYRKTPAGDKIMDFSHAGYMGGGVALPDVPVKKTIRPSGGADDTGTIQEALDVVSALPLVNGFRGAVLLVPGVYTCAKQVSIQADGVVLRGSGAGEGGSIIRMTGPRHTAVVVSKNRSLTLSSTQAEGFIPAATVISTSYVPSGAISIGVADSKGFSTGDLVEIRKPVTRKWIEFMEMHNLVRDGNPQTWIKEGSTINTCRAIASIEGNTLTLDVPLSDSFDSRFAEQGGIAVVKVRQENWIFRAGVENLRIQAPPMETTHEQALYSALRIYGQDCWAKSLLIEETMNSVGAGGRRITLEEVKVTRTVPNVGASKPAEFAPNASQILMNRCSSHGDNIWHAATGSGIAGPIVLLNCMFTGNGRAEGHQRWTTGILADNCQVPDGGIDFKNRGSMGSGHGWGTAWSVAWNCVAKNYVVQQPPGSYNWMIGCTGANLPTPRPFDRSPALPLGVSDSPDKKVNPSSLYLTQLEERLGRQALRNIGY